MPTYKSPMAYDSTRCEYSVLGANDQIPPENVPVAGILSEAECNLLSTDNDGLLKLCASDLISTIDGGNVIGVNPDDNKLYINPCLIPGPQNIVSNKEGNIIQKDPDDCSAYLSALSLTDELFSFADERNYFGPGLVYIENQDGSHQLRVASCSGLTVEDATLTDGAGNVHNVKALAINLDPASSLLHFAPNADQCQDCLSTCDTLAFTMSLNANGTKLRVLDKDGAVYTSINLGNGLQGDGSGGLTINTLDAMGNGTSDLPVSAKALKNLLDNISDGERGLVQDSDGYWAVDFDSMPTDKFEALLKAANIPIFIDGTKVKRTFYVNQNTGLDNVTDTYTQAGNTYTRGTSASMPWKTIQYAINTITRYYNINSQAVLIYIAAGTYNFGADYTASGQQGTYLSLGDFQRTTGSITLLPLNSGTGDYVPSYDHNSGTYDDVVLRCIDKNPTLFKFTGGRYVVRNMKLEVITQPKTEASWTYNSSTQSWDKVAGVATAVYPSIFGTSGNAHVTLSGCQFRFTSGALADTASVRYILERNYLFNVYEGTTCYFNRGCSFYVDKGNSNATYVFHPSDNGSQIEFSGVHNTVDTQYQYLREFYVEGSWTTLLDITQKGSLIMTNAASIWEPYFSYYANRVSGKPYSINSGGSLTVNVKSDNSENTVHIYDSNNTIVSAIDLANAIPGSSSGTADASTYSWVNTNGGE